MVVTLSKLTNVLIEHGLTESVAKEYAQSVLDIFGFQTYIIDNVLETAAHEGGERDMFYMLEEEGILTTAEEELYLPPPRNNKMWRIHYWCFDQNWDKPKKKTIEESAKNVPELEAICYLNGNVPDDVWKQHATIENKAIAL